MEVGSAGLLCLLRAQTMLKSEITNRVVELVSDKGGEMRQLVGSWIDIVLNDIASHGLFTMLKREERTNLIAGQRNYELGEDTDHVYQVFVPSWGDPAGRLKKRDDEQLLDLMFQDGFGATGRPWAYNIFAGRTLRLHPIPDADNSPASPTDFQKLYVWKYRDITTLQETDEIREIKLKHVPTLIYGAYAMGAKFDSILDADNAEAKYKAGINRLFFDDKTDLHHPKQVVYRELG